MTRKSTGLAAGAAAFAATLSAGAQTAAPPPLPPDAASAAYRSVFEGYRPFAAQEIGDWREANEAVRQIGGWRAYAREIQAGSQPPAQRPDDAPGAQAPSPSVPAAQPHPHQGQQR